MKAVLGADPRPNCLIIDEIDGAPQVRKVKYRLITWQVLSGRLIIHGRFTH